MNYKNGYDYYLYNNKIYLAGYPNVINNKGEKHISSGYIKKVDTFKFLHSLDTRSGSSGSPICLIDNKSVIGIHKGGNKEKQINNGSFIGVILDDLENDDISKYKGNNDYPFNDEIKNNLNNIILVGQSGVGKTYFLNKICNTDFELNKEDYYQDYSLQKKSKYNMVIQKKVIV